MSNTMYQIFDVGNISNRGIIDRAYSSLAET